MGELILEHVYKSYHKDTYAIQNFNLTIKEKEFIVIVGPSGCGKSTLLRLIAGLEKPTDGHIYIDGKNMNNVPPKNRNIAFVFQHYALYPHMNVYENIAFGLKSRNIHKEKIHQRVHEVAQLLELEKYVTRKPNELSGGQRQRVALGRAIVRDAKIFLMDEPLSNLDAKLRTQMRSLIIKLHQQLKTTVLYVTHDQIEAMTMATRLIVMNEGEIQQIGTPKEVYDTPNNVFVAGFIGSPSMNFITGKLTTEKVMIGNVSISIPKNIFQRLHEQGYENEKIMVGIRPEDVRLSADTEESLEYTFLDVNANVIELLGPEAMVHTKIDKQPFIFRVNARQEVKEGQVLSIAIEMNKMHFFDIETKKRISINR